MSTALPITAEDEDEARQLVNTIAHHLGDKIYQRHPERYPDADVPAPLKKGGALTESNPNGNFGSIVAFHNGGPFVRLHIKKESEGEFAVSYTGSASYDKFGTQQDLWTYFEAFDTLLNQLDVFYDEYTITCPCGFEKTISPSFVEARESFNDHNAEQDDRISSGTLAGRNIEAHASERQNPSRLTQAESDA